MPPEPLRLLRINMALKYKFLILLLATAFVPLMINSTIDLTSMHATLQDLSQIDESSLIRHIDKMIVNLEKLIFEKLTRDAVTLIILGFCVIIASIIISTRLAKPLRQLADMSRRLQKGDFSVRSNIRRKDEIGKLAEAFDDMAPALAERMRMAENLGLAGQAQQYLMSHAKTTIHGFDIAGRNVPCDETGGDYFDVVTIDDTKSIHDSTSSHQQGWVVLGDVCGHGIAAALQMATARALLRGFVETTPSLQRIMNRLNLHLHRDLDDGQFVTMFCLHIDRNNPIRWCNAGHEPALLFNVAQDQIHELSQRHLPLGIDPDHLYNDMPLAPMKKGDILAILSDGISDTQNVKKEFYTRIRVKKILRRHADQSASSIRDALIKDVKRFRGKMNMIDDMTVVIVKFLEDKNGSQKQGSKRGSNA